MTSSVSMRCALPYLWCGLSLFGWSSSICFASSDEKKLLDLSIEELADLTISSVSKKEQRLQDAAASIYVITQEAINKSGAANLPEALRLAPNLQVAQISANQYAISARGFNSSTANKLLVLIDGRTVYTPLYSGVFWDAQDVVLQDIERIEVISGPGGTLWGANAVNGVINITTRRAQASDPKMIQVVAGNKGQALVLSHSGTLNERAAYRIYAKADEWQDVVSGDSRVAPASWRRSQIGFRSNWRDADNELSLQADAYQGQAFLLQPGSQTISGMNFMGRWQHQFEQGSKLKFQAYFDRTSRDYPGVFKEQLHTLDLDLMYILPDSQGTALSFGGGYRIAYDDVLNSNALAFLPAQRYLRWANLFAQREQDLSPNLRLTLGGKLESNDYTGLEILPNLKLAWKAADDTLIWLDLSRAVRAPSRLDTQFYIPGKAPYQLIGGPDFRSEIAKSLSLGVRAKLANFMPYSLTLFRSAYTNLRSFTIRPTNQYELSNQIQGRVEGVEAWASLPISKTIALDLGATYLRQNFTGPFLNLSLPGNDPRSQLLLGLNWQIALQHHLNLKLRHVAALPQPSVSAYTSLDMHYAWKMNKQLEFAVSGRNLLDAKHEEFPLNSSGNLQVFRQFQLALTVRF